MQLTRTRPVGSMLRSILALLLTMYFGVELSGASELGFGKTSYRFAYTPIYQFQTDIDRGQADIIEKIE